MIKLLEVVLGFALFLVIVTASSGNLIVVLAALGTWAIAVMYCFPHGFESLRVVRRENAALLRAQQELTAIRTRPRLTADQRTRLIQDLISVVEQHRKERAEHLADSLVWLAVGIMLYPLGLYLFSTVLDAGQVVAFVFGPIFLGTAYWIMEHLRRNWPLYRRGGHRNAVLLHIVGITGLVAIGVLILVIGL